VELKIGKLKIQNLCLAAGVVLLSTSVHAQWPQWRGPARDGAVPAASVPKAWPETLQQAWAVEVATLSYSSTAAR
jgi:outer membrane protein assembly factor BamB